MIANKIAMLTATNELFDNFIIEDYQVTKINHGGLYIALTYIGVVILSTIIWFFIHRYDYSTTRETIIETLKMTMFSMTCCGIFILIIGAVTNIMICDRYNKIYQESATIVSEYNEVKNIKSISINKCKSTSSENKFEKFYTCATINDSNIIEIMEIPYEKVTLINDETAYIEIHYDNIKYLNDDTQTIMKSVDIHITEDMIETIIGN